ncbi:MAG: YwqJ-related putative deaminase [Streptomyces sp.]|uniref:YwqJ-related putative deaminase n=1 Tax=Streptomyces sp. TaxID=1931 RepID=UPI003D6AC439
MNAAPPSPSAPPPSAPPPSPDPRVGWTGAPDDPAPALHHRRDGILPAIAAALSVRGQTLTSTGNKGDQPPAPHPLVQDFLDTLTTDHRERHTGRCTETVLLSRFLKATEGARTSKRTGRKSSPRPLTPGEARRALKHAKLTARHIREDGDPLHGSYAPPCRSCTALLAHFGVRAVDPGHDADTQGARAAAAAAAAGREAGRP